MPAITKHNDQYTIECRYKNKNAVANKISTTAQGVQFAGNDPSAFLAGQPNNSFNSPWFNGVGALTSSKNVMITGSLFVSDRIFADEFHTTFVTTSIIFQEGDTIFGNTTDDTHKFTGNITASGTSSFGKIRVGALPGDTTPGASTVASFGGTGEAGVAVSISPTNNQDKITTWRDYDGENIFRAEGRVANNTLLISLGDSDEAGSGNALRIRSDQSVFRTGNVGIGTSYTGTNADMTVSSKLQVQGNISASGQLNIGKLGSSNGHITASGNIRASGNIISTNVSASGYVTASAIWIDANTKSQLAMSGSIKKSLDRDKKIIRLICKRYPKSKSIK